MIRLAPTFFFVVLFCLTVIGQTKSDRTRANLNGAVKTVKELHYRHSDSKPEERDSVVYDQKGNEIERTMINDYGQLMGKQIQKFDADGSIKESIFNDEKGRPIDKRVYETNAGKLVKILTYDGKGILREKTVRKYNTAGEFSEEIYFDPTTERAKTVFRYDDKGNSIEMSFFMSDGTKAIAPVGPCLGGHRVTFTYDKNDRPLTKTIFDASDNVKKTSVYTWDNRGNVLTYSSKSSLSTSKFSYTYEFDEKGNWVKQTAISEQDGGGLFDMMSRSTVNLGTEEERKKAEEQMKKLTMRQTVTVRQIAYY